MIVPNYLLSKYRDLLDIDKSSVKVSQNIFIYVITDVLFFIFVGNQKLCFSTNNFLVTLGHLGLICKLQSFLGDNINNMFDSGTAYKFVLMKGLPLKLLHFDNPEGYDISNRIQKIENMVKYIWKGIFEKTRFY